MSDYCLTDINLLNGTLLSHGTYPCFWFTRTVLVMSLSLLHFLKCNLETVILSDYKSFKRTIANAISPAPQYLVKIFDHFVWMSDHECLGEKCLQSINTWRTSQNGHHFAADIFKCIFLGKNLRFLFKAHSNLFPLTQLKLRYKTRIGLDNGLSPNIIWTNDGLVYWCI